MKPALSIKQTADMSGAIRRAVANLTGQDVFIGVPADDDERGDIKKKDHGAHGRASHGINNAELSYIHEFGAPAAGIPARPHLIPGIEKIIPKAANELKEAAAQAFKGNEQAVDKALNHIGQLGESSVRAMFQDNDWQPLKAETLDYKPLLKNDEGKVLTYEKGKRKGQPKRGKSRREQGKLNPLLVTAQLMKSHTYVIRKRGGGNGLITPQGAGNGA